MTFTALSQNRVELRWLKAVTHDSAGRFVRLARLQNPSFAILGVPTGFDTDVVFAADDAAALAPTGVADDVRMAPVEAETAAPDKAAAPETPSRRIVGSMLSARPTSASHAVPLANDAEAAPAADGKAAPAAVAKVAAAAQLLLARLLASKAENICRKFLDAGSLQAQVPGRKYCVAWEITLGKGTWGTVHKGFRHSVPLQ